MEYEINEQKSIMDYKRSMDHGLMMRYIEIFVKRYPFLELTSIGKSSAGKSIPMIVLGKGEESCLYVGAARPSECITSIILLRFINEYCELYKAKSRIYNNTLDYLYSSKTIRVVPMLDVDGVDCRSWGLSIKKGDELTETEQGAGVLSNFLRFGGDIRALLSLGLGNEEIFCPAGENVPPRALPIARSLERMSGYTLVREGENGSVTQTANELGISSFDVRCTEGKRGFNADTIFKIYADMREVLFRLPCMI